MAVALPAIEIQDAAPLPLITIKPMADGSYMLTVAPFEENLLGPVTDAISDRAAQTCGGKSLLWGNLTYTGDISSGPGKPALVREYRRGFRCVATDAAVYPPAPAGWKPAPSDAADVDVAFGRFFAMIDSGAFARAYAMFEDGAGGDRTSWIDSERRGYALIGSGTRRVTGIRWAPNPPGAPHPGVYVRVTFTGSFSTAKAYCGATTFYRAGPGDYRVVGNQEHLLPNSENPSDARIAEFKANYCE